MSEVWYSGDMCSVDPDDCRDQFYRVMDVMRAEGANFGIMIGMDASVRATYQQQVSAAARSFEREVAAGRMNWQQAADQASALRNEVMDTLRGRSSPVGRALAESMKAQGLNRTTLLAKYTERLFGAGQHFSDLSPTQQNQVYKEIVEAAGRSNPRVNARVARWSRVGKGLIVFSVALSVYNIAVAEDPAAQAGEEVAITGGGVLGGMAGGATAGLVCGPGAPLCVTVGAFIGGALGALGVSLFF